MGMFKRVRRPEATAGHRVVTDNARDSTVAHRVNFAETILPMATKFATAIREDAHRAAETEWKRPVGRNDLSPIVLDPNKRSNSHRF